MNLQRLPFEAEVLPVLVLPYQLDSLKTIEKFWLRGKRAKILPPKPYNITAVKFFASSTVYVYREFEGTETVEDGIVLFLGDRLLPPLNRSSFGTRPVKYDFENLKVGESKLIRPGVVKRPAVAYAAIQSFRHRTASEIKLTVIRDTEGLKVARTG